VIDRPFSTRANHQNLIEPFVDLMNKAAYAKAAFEFRDNHR